MVWYIIKLNFLLGDTSHLIPSFFIGKKSLCYIIYVPMCYVKLLHGFFSFFPLYSLFNMQGFLEKNFLTLKKLTRDLIITGHNGDIYFWSSSDEVTGPSKRFIVCVIRTPGHVV